MLPSATAGANNALKASIMNTRWRKSAHNVSNGVQFWL